VLIVIFLILKKVWNNNLTKQNIVILNIVLLHCLCTRRFLKVNYNDQHFISDYMTANGDKVEFFIVVEQSRTLSTKDFPEGRGKSGGHII
jgi:hypothetical protein